jgi:hypothetical protein
MVVAAARLLLSGGISIWRKKITRVQAQFVQKNLADSRSKARA